MENFNNKKISTSISIDYNKWEYIKNSRVNLSEWINDKIGNELMSKQARIEQLKNEIEQAEKEIGRLENELKQEEKEREDYIKSISPEELEELKNTAEILESRGNEFFQGRLNRYRNSFKPEITKEEFVKLINIIKINNK